jgi:hypothetical protein
MLFSLSTVWGWQIRIKKGTVHPITGHEDQSGGTAPIFL